MTRTRARSHKKTAIAASDPSPGDSITLGLALGVAALSAMFAGYMWTSVPNKDDEARLIVENIALQADDKGRTDVRPISPTIGNPTSDSPASDDRQSAPQADPITTASVPAASTRFNEPDKWDQNTGVPGAAPRLDRFVLLGIYADTALITQAGPGTQRMWPVKIGSLLPGAGRVIAFTTTDEKPSVLTTTGLISLKDAGP